MQTNPTTILRPTRADIKKKKGTSHVCSKLGHQAFKYMFYESGSIKASVPAQMPLMVSILVSAASPREQNNHNNHNNKKCKNNNHREKSQANLAKIYMIAIVFS